MELKIRIQSLEDAKNGIPIIENLDPKDVTEVQDLTVGILEGGTVSGATSLMFVLKTTDGKSVMAQITAKQFDGLMGAFLGAIERFGK